MAEKKKTKKTAAKKKTPSKAKKKSTQKLPAYSMWIVVCALLTVALFVFLYIDAGAALNHAVKIFLMGLFGKTAYLIPIALGGLTVYLSRTRDMRRFEIKSAFVFGLLLDIASLVHLCEKVVIPVSSAYSYGTQGTGGGLFGGAVGYGLYAVCHRVVPIIVLFALLVVLASVITKVSIVSAVTTFIKGFFTGIKDEVTDIQPVDNFEVGAQTTQKLIEHTQKKHTEVFDLPIDIEPEKPVKKKKKKQEQENVQNEPESEVNVITPELPEDIFHAIDETVPHRIEDQAIYEPETAVREDKPESVNEEPVKAEIKKKEKNMTDEEKSSMENELNEAMKAEKPEYVFPPVELLAAPKAVSSDIRREMYETANRLIEVLRDFGVEAKLLQVTQGPAVTRYEIQPSTGVKLSKISGLSEDIALNLAVPTVLVAPVPGKAAVGIEIPNREVGMVSIREMIASKEFQTAKSKISFAIGKDIAGRVIVGDLAKMPHLLIAGQTGSGKSVCINTIITSILYKANPDEVKFIMVDPKVVELGVYNGIPNLLIPVVTDPKRAAGALNWAVQEMMKRYEMFAEAGVRNLTGYNELLEKNGEEKISQIVIIIDELADLMMVAAKEVEDYVCRLTQLARAAGIHLIVATQRPTVDVITGLIKANIPSRIAFSVASQTDSRTILDRGGADKLLGKGDMLYFPTGASAATRVQGAFVSDEEIEKLVDFLKEECEDNTYSEDLAEQIERCAIGENGVTPDEKDDGDEFLPRAIQLAAELGQISTAMVQRKLKVGYARAGRIIDQMEDRGIISGANGSKPRQVYLDRIQYMNTEAALANTDSDGDEDEGIV